jgi:hypothetical protein
MILLSVAAKHSVNMLCLLNTLEELYEYPNVNKHAVSAGILISARSTERKPTTFVKASSNTSRTLSF